MKSKGYIKTGKQKKRPRLGRICPKELGGCGKRFIPTGKFQKFCRGCIEKKIRIRHRKRDE